MDAIRPDDSAPKPRVLLGSMLVDAGLITNSQLEEALAVKRATGDRLGDVFVSLGLVPERELARVLGEQLDFEVVDLRSAELDRDVVALLPEETAVRLGAIPIRRADDRIVVAVGDPLPQDLTTELIAVLQSPVRLVIAARSDIDRAIASTYRSTMHMGDALRVFEERMEERRSAIPLGPAQIIVDENAPVVQVVNMLLEQAVRDRASDVHIEPQADRVRVRVRTDGALHEVSSLPMALGPSLVSCIKVMANMNIVERRRPQDGQLALTVADKELDIRVATTGTMFGEKCVMRLLDKSRALYSLDELGMPDDVAEVYSSFVRSPYGMVICAGPTGSGKTTTLYATMSEIADDSINVMTIEDPVEYVFPSINQIQINEQAGITFASVLRAIMRHDPDAILVGEIRDAETARIAIQAALTGHFVMSSLHATDTASAIHRFIDMGVEPFLVASSVVGIVSQRLLRRLCPHCAEPHQLNEDERAFYLRMGGDASKLFFLRGAGCNFCGHTGYFGRIGIYEVMSVTDVMRRLIAERASHEALREAAVAQGMRTLQDQALRLVTEDVSTMTEMIRTVSML